MKLTQTIFSDVIVIEPTVFEDERGWFFESFNEERFHFELKKFHVEIPPRFVQDNHSFSRKNVLRGLHYQLPPHAQGKLVRVVQGAVYDVVVDIREGSSTFGHWVGHHLSAENKKMVWIPVGFAHGFLALEDNTHFLYKTTDFYNKESEACIRWNDPSLAIDWQLKEKPILNAKDELAPLIDKMIKVPVNSFRTSLTHNKEYNLSNTSSTLGPTFHFWEGNGEGSFKQGQKMCGLVDIKVIGDARGSLIVMQQGCNIPFNLKRAYYIFGTKFGVSRGFHAHRTLRQLAVCVSGSCRIILDNGMNRKNYWLDAPTKGLLIGNMVWREMHDFSDNCVLIIFANEEYDEADYIRSYQEFKKLVIT